jgi:Uma2 family endonuclease
MSSMPRSASRIIRRQLGRGIAEPFFHQGTWSEEEYLALDTNWLVEFSNGRLEILPMPTTSHQILVDYLHSLLKAFASAHDLGTTLFAALRVLLWPGKYREPDVVFMRKEHADRIREEFWQGADLLMEVVSNDPEDRRRDLVTKRREYAKARIPEYWIVDPKDETITVLRLSGTRYVVHGTFGQGDIATSHLLPGFAVNVREAFSQQIGKATARPAKRSRKNRNS